MNGITATQWPLVGRRAELARLGDLLSSPESCGVVIAGPSGAGKTRFAGECLALTEQMGFATARVLATQSAATIPLGALSPLLPALAEARSPAELLRRARAEIAERGRGRRLALLVDDAHLLDPMSATLLVQLATEREAFVIATVRSMEPAPDAVVALWKDGITERLELGALDASAVAELLSAVLGGDVDGSTLRRFAEASGGNALLLRELLLGAAEAGLVRQEDGLWRLVGALPLSARLVEIVTTRLGAIGEREREALEVVAYGEPLGVGSLEERFGTEALHRLDRLGLIVVVHDGRRVEARLGHPLYGEVLRAGVPAMRARRVSGIVAALVARGGARRHDDALRLGACALAAGGPFEPDVMLAAAGAARRRYDLPLAQRLAEAAASAGGGFAAALTTAQLHILQGRPDEAERRLVEVREEERTDAERVALAATRIDNLALGLGRPDDALRVAWETEAMVASEELRDEVAAKRAELLFLQGRITDALEVFLPILGRAPARTVALVASTAALCLLLRGRLGEAIEVTERGYAAHLSQNGLPLTAGPHTALMVRGVALGHAGRIEEALRLGESGYRGAVADGSLEAHGSFAELLSWLSLLEGRPSTAQRYAAEAAGVFRQLGWGQYLRFALGHLAHASALLGATDQASRVVAELEALDIPATDVAGALVIQSRAWVAVATGDVDRARGLLREAVRVAEASGDRVGEVAALHDLARTGSAAEVVDRLRDLATVVEGGLASTRAAYAAALVAGDGTALDEVASAFSALGAGLFAAEAAAGAAVALRRGGDPRRAAAAERRMQALLRQCEDAVTPATFAVGAQVLLTPQELKVAGLAAAGMANKEIAARIGVSVRTVETQLQRAYDKLGVRRRYELPEALAL
ncbi:MAG TPA: LuxR C-terminal-related transcriptional regulator [Acidimicrobiales bacterium]|nr:LuxR C-terminal-related transcriptional regulator [Acidimicrobiales bacterium]